MHEKLASSYDVTIVGAGLAGLALARQLLLYTDKTVLLLDKRLNPPGPTQKVGESLVQTSGYYLSKVLDLEEHLMSEHYFKYNLRFQWKTAGLENRGLEDYSKSFIRMGSNLATFQLDRNLLETHLLKVCRENPRFHFEGGVGGLEADLAEQGPHRVAFSGKATQSDWVVDASGRGQFLKKKLGLLRENPIRHGSTWCWVEGLVNIEKLTDLPWSKVRNNRDRMKQGSFPQFLATNHFAGEGRWFWVIPLHGKTSLGLVYDKSVIASEDVSTARKMLDYVCREWPLFERDLPHRKILDEGRFFDFSYDAQQTISPQHWAMTGEAGRFSDPLYSPGGDLISIYNTLITDAILTGDQASLERKCRTYETVMRVVYEAYVPSYAVSYDCLGDQQCFMYKYGWELAVYFGFYVLPFINDLFTDEEFLPVFLRKFGLLGPINRMLQKFLSDFFQWKKTNVPASVTPELHDFYEMMPLRNSELLFYQVGLTREEATEALERQFNSLKGFARWIVAQVYATVLADPMIGMDTEFTNSIKLRNIRFDPQQMLTEYRSHGKKGEMAVA